jgi:hypothetical protein
VFGLARSVVHGRTIGHRGDTSNGAPKRAYRADTGRQHWQGGSSNHGDNGSHETHLGTLRCGTSIFRPYGGVKSRFFVERTATCE